MGRQGRSSEIRRRRARHQKLAVLRQRYAAARTEAERTRLLAKVNQIAPAVTAEQFLSRVKRGTATA